MRLISNGYLIKSRFNRWHKENQWEKEININTTQIRIPFKEDIIEFRGGWFMYKFK